MLVYLGFAALAMLAISIIYTIKDPMNENCCGMLILSTILSLAANMPTVINYTIAANRQAVINKQEPIIAHYRDYIERLDRKIIAAAKEGRQTIFTSNHDTPVKSMVEAQLKAENDMLSAAKARDEAEIELEAIRLGLYGKVVDWIPKTKENK
jgi:hypothetical protein